MQEIVIVEKINEALMKIVLDGSITYKEFKRQERIISRRCDYIVRKIMQIQKVNLNWWDFDNGGEIENARGEIEHFPEGYFDPNLYSQNVGFYCKYFGEVLNFGILPYHNSFPTRWIWVDFEEVCELEYQNSIQRWSKLKSDFNINREAREELKTQALQKLTPEEIKALGY